MFALFLLTTIEADATRLWFDFPNSGTCQDGRRVRDLKFCPENRGKQVFRAICRTYDQCVSVCQSKGEGRPKVGRGHRQMPCRLAVATDSGVGIFAFPARTFEATLQILSIYLRVPSHLDDESVGHAQTS